MTFKKLMEQEFVFLDGAMGTMLQRAGLEPGERPEFFGMEHPDIITNIHKQYIASGADIIYANTFGANRHKLGDKSLVQKAITTAIQSAREATVGTETLVALDIGQTGELVEPTGTATFEEMYGMFLEMVDAGKDADLVVIETMADLYEIKAAVLAAKTLKKPVMTTMSFEKNLRTFLGCPVSAMAVTLESLGVDALGMNCSVGPEDAGPILEEIAKYTSLPLIVKPNAGMPDPVSGAYSVGAEEFGGYMKALVPYGAKLVGGCCGTDPAFIQCIRNNLKEMRYQKQAVPEYCAVSSATKTVLLDGTEVVGSMKLSAEEKTINNIVEAACLQEDAGADVLEINIGPCEDEFLKKAIKAVQAVSSAPLKIVVCSESQQNAAYAICNGKPLITFA